VSATAADGSALVVVLAMVVLLTALTVAFFSRALLEQQISASSANQTKVDLFAQGIVATIQAELKQEITDPAYSTTFSGTPMVSGTIYRPKTFADAAPSRASLTGLMTGDLPNLVKMSAASHGFYGNEASRASSASTTGTSLNGRAISLERWNKPLLLPKLNPNSTDLTPVSAVTAPDWILVSRDGDNPTAANEKVVGRYAYMIYNEGGLLDANVAGYPRAGSVSGSQRLALSRKGSSAFADLTVLPGLADLGGSRAEEIVNQLTGWRNFAVARFSGNFPALTVSSDTLDRYLNYATRHPARGLTVSGSFFNGQSDRQFISRQQLIKFLTEAVADNDDERAKLQTALHYLGTFSRSLNQPSYWPDPDRPKIVRQPKYGGEEIVSNAEGHDNDVNPQFRSVQVTTAIANSGATRNDGSKFVTGEPLVKKRFPLSYLLWLTYKGPSVTGMSNGDDLFQAYVNTGMSANEVERLRRLGTPENIRKYFGLEWQPPRNGRGGYWEYVHRYQKSDGYTVATLDDVLLDERREPNFFELLQAAICAGSLGVTRNIGGTGGDLSDEDGFKYYQSKRLDSRVDFHTLQIGVNIIDQSQPENFPTLLVFHEGGARDYVRPFWGTVDLPYMSSLMRVRLMTEPPAAALMPVPQNFWPEEKNFSFGASLDTKPNGGYLEAGTMVVMEVPVLWNTHRQINRALPGPAQLRAGVSNAVINRPSSAASTNGHSTFVSAIKANPPVYTTDSNGNTSVERIGNIDSMSAPWDNGYVEMGDNGTGMVLPLSANGINTFVYFPADSALYREPTPLLRSVGALTLSIDANNALVRPEVKRATSAWRNGVPETGDSGGAGTEQFFGCLFGTHPARMLKDNGIAVVGGKLVSRYQIWSIDSAQQNGAPLTVTLEYLDPVSGGWTPYKQYLHRINFNGMTPPTLRGSWDPAVLPSMANNNQSQPKASAMANLDIMGMNGEKNYRAHARNNAFFDPRSARWGTVKDWHCPPMLASSVDPSRTMLETFRPGADNGGGMFDAYIGLVSQNKDLSKKGVNLSATYEDPDTVVRRAMGAWVPTRDNWSNATTTIGLPQATVLGNSNNQYNRPLMLNRPFRSVAELGVVYRDVPWRNLDFFTPESGDAALLDVFCVADDERGDALEAGKVDLNTRNAPVVRALLAGAYRDEFSALANNDTALSTGESLTLAQLLVERTSGNARGQGPFSNVADLVGRWIPGSTKEQAYEAWNFTDGATTYSGFSDDLGNYQGGSPSANNLVQSFRETAMRALSDAGQAGIWNLLIDVVAQTGHYPNTAGNTDDFMVDGERRYWVHLAIDRQTGRVIDQQLEVVNE
jgi:Tfp pilus assembly protein PilX